MTTIDTTKTTAPAVGYPIRQTAKHTLEAAQADEAEQSAARKLEEHDRNVEALRNELRTCLSLTPPEGYDQETILLDGLWFRIVRAANGAFLPALAVSHACETCGAIANRYERISRSEGWLSLGHALEALEAVTESPLCQQHAEEAYNATEHAQADAAVASGYAHRFIPEPTPAERIAKAVADLVTAELRERGIGA